MPILYQTRFFESGKSAVLIDGLDCSSRNSQNHGLFELRNIHTLLFEVSVFSYLAGRVELGSSSGVAVATAHNRMSFCDCADFCHVFG